MPKFVKCDCEKLDFNDVLVEKVDEWEKEENQLLIRNHVFTDLKYVEINGVKYEVEMKIKLIQRKIKTEKFFKLR